MKNRMFLLFCGAWLLLWFAGCSDEPSATEVNLVRITYVSQESEFLFAGRPVRLGVQSFYQSSSNISCEWHFGDGESSNESYPTHTYTFPGTYRITVIADLGKKFSRDTLITILPPPKVFGAKTSKETGIFLYQDKSHYYRVLYTSEGTGAPRFGLMALTPELDSVYAKLLPFQWEQRQWTVPPMVNTQENLVVLNNQFWRFDLTANLLATQTIQRHDVAPRLTENAGEYDLTSTNYNASLVFIDHLNSQGELTDHQQYDVSKSGYDYAGVTFKGTDQLLLHYKKPGTLNTLSTTLVSKRKLNGEVLFEKEYTLSAVFDIIPLTSGYVYSAEAYFDFNGSPTGPEAWHVSTRVDEKGEVLWQVDNAAMQGRGYGIGYGPPLQVLEIDGFTYIFQENMIGTKVDPDGKVVWSRFFGSTRYDIFNMAIVNNKNNLVLLGSQDGDHSDLMLMEIDQNGNLVSHP
ncbi:PKD domain-containing protein [Chryseolinea serpens]|nr:PKD domain-containing protein [Chryseolinea serpens]